MRLILVPWWVWVCICVCNFGINHGNWGDDLINVCFCELKNLLGTGFSFRRLSAICSFAHMLATWENMRTRLLCASNAHVWLCEILRFQFVSPSKRTSVIAFSLTIDPLRSFIERCCCLTSSLFEYVHLYTRLHLADMELFIEFTWIPYALLLQT